MTGGDDPGRSLLDSGGFTLLELIIVTTILGILVILAVPQLRESSARARVAAAKSDLHNLAVAEESYFSDYGAYTEDLDELDFEPSDGVTVEIRLPGAGGGGGGPGGGGGGPGGGPPGGGPPGGGPPGGGPPGGGGGGDASGGWSARAIPEAASDTCAVFVGSAEPYEPAEEEGIVTCSSSG